MVGPSSRRIAANLLLCSAMCVRSPAEKIGLGSWSRFHYLNLRESRFASRPPRTRASTLAGMPSPTSEPRIRGRHVPQPVADLVGQRAGLEAPGDVAVALPRRVNEGGRVGAQHLLDRRDPA